MGSGELRMWETEQMMGQTMRVDGWVMFILYRLFITFSSHGISNTIQEQERQKSYQKGGMYTHTNDSHVLESVQLIQPPNPTQPTTPLTL